MESLVQNRLLVVLALSVSGCSLANDLDEYTGGRSPDAAVDSASPGDTSADTGVDTGATVDSAIADTGTLDSSPGDTGEDTTVVDTGTPDTGTPDTGTPDTGTPDAGPDAPVGCHVVINEVQVAGASASDEFVELFNPCSAPISLTSWKLAYRSASGGSDTTLADLSSFTIANGGYLVFAGSGFTGTKDGSIGGATGALSGSAGGVAIRDDTNAVVDSMGYGGATNAFVEGSAAALPSSGMSVARKPNGADTNVNSADFVVSTPTPGASNGS